jgi:D-3-phosphoglycerate dehydrogenase
MPHVVFLRGVHPDATARLDAEPGFTYETVDPSNPEALAAVVRELRRVARLGTPKPK